MFRNNLKVAFRSLRKNKIYTAINLIGLTVGIAAALLIFRMVNYEMSFNKNFRNHDRIVRAVTESKKPQGMVIYSACIPLPAMDAMENTVSQFEEMSRVREMWGTLTIANEVNGVAPEIFGMDPTETGFFVESDFFKIFDFQWLAGEPVTALAEPGSIVLTKRWAEKCFVRWEEAVGKTVLIDNVIPVQVRGVVADLPENCDFPIPFLVSYPTLLANAEMYGHRTESWGNCRSSNQVFALLHDADQLDAANVSIAQIGQTEYNNNGRSRNHLLQPLSDLHFNEDYGTSGTHIVSKSRLRMLSGIGILILIMACFNFINLATAQATLRSKEVGVRKTLGGRKGQLVGQFMSETGVLVVSAVVLGANLAVFCVPLLSLVSDVPNELPFLSNPMIIGFLALVSILVTLMAGLYPAFALSSFQPVMALKNNVGKYAFSGASLRKSLVVLQFVIAQVLIIGAIISLNQMDYIHDKDLGFDKDLVYTFGYNSDSTTVARQEALRQEIAQIPSVESVSLNARQPLSGGSDGVYLFPNVQPDEEGVRVEIKYCDADFLTTYGLNMLAGEWLSPSDTVRDAVVNQTLLQLLEFENPQQAIGQEFLISRRQPVRIIGVIEDFHAHSMRREHAPILMTTRKDYYREAGVKIRPDDIAGTISSIQTAFKKVLPDQVFTGQFLDERIAQYYIDDNRLATTCQGFGLLAILISCLGLFGLATHAASQRYKEIGIRKVLGATTIGIVGLLSKDFLKLVLAALVIASPLAYYFMENWLQDFVYRIEISWWVFGSTGLVALIVAFLTVGFQSVKAAVANPVESLRSE